MIPSILMKDGYKADHRRQYPEGTEFIYANFTPRGTRVDGCEAVVVFGIQYMLKKFFVEEFNKTFFERPKEQVLEEYKHVMDGYLGEDMINTDHLGELHDLGFLPLHIKALPEGTRCPLKVPILTVINTDPRFFWLTNMLETLISTTLWHPITSATTADRYRAMFDKYAIETGADGGFVPFQGHDFSMRGLCGVEAATVSAAAHLTSFVGSDTIPAIPFLQDYYNATGLIAASVPATEHSVMCLGEKDTEIETFKRLINEVYPSGIVSIVSDTWDFWEVVTGFLPTLKDDIMARDGKVVIRPDSGDPVHIICGTLQPITIELDGDEEWGASVYEYMYDWMIENTDHGEHGGDVTMHFNTPDGVREVTFEPDWNRHDKKYYFMDNYGDWEDYLTVVDATNQSPEQKGLIQCLWDTFGGTVNKEGYKVLDPHIGAIYGDSITYERADTILKRLKDAGFSSENIVFGIGSFTYQYVTRDTHCFAMKATLGIVNGEDRAIFKDPKTDDGMKKSARGYLRVSDDLTLTDDVSYHEETNGALRTVFLNGSIYEETTLDEVRGRLR